MTGFFYILTLFSLIKNNVFRQTPEGVDWQPQPECSAHNLNIQKGVEIRTHGKFRQQPNNTYEDNAKNKQHYHKFILNYY